MAPLNRTKAPFAWRKFVLGKSVTLLAESTLARVYKRKKFTPRAYSDYLNGARMP